MIIEHAGKSPRIDADAYVAPNAVVCGDVTIAAGARVLFGAVLCCEGGRIEIGEQCVVMQNAVIRATGRFSTRIAAHCLIGPGAHLVGCTLEESVFVATGASIFHGAHLGTRCEVRINGVVHLRSVLPPDTTVPIGWVAVGNPTRVLPPESHDEIWRLQAPLDFPGTVYGVDRPAPGETSMPEITRRLSEMYATFADDEIVPR